MDIRQRKHMGAIAALGGISALPNEGVDTGKEFFFTFSPETYVPERFRTIYYTEDMTYEEANTPERRLIAEVINRAICDYVELRFNETKRRKMALEWYMVKKWLHSNDDFEFTFIWCVQAVCSKPEMVIKAVRKKVQTVTQEEEELFRDVIKGYMPKPQAKNIASIFSKKRCMSQG